MIYGALTAGLSAGTKSLPAATASAILKSIVSPSETYLETSDL